MKNFYLLFSVILLHAFFINSVKAQSSLDIQGHRGCRGLCPENTIPGFIKAIDLGATTLEMDVVITKDNQVVLSHDPFLNHEICEGPHKEIITEKNEKEFNIYRMSYNELQKCDCGSKIHNRFLTQAKFVSYKPLLETVIDTVEKYISYKKLKPIQYNIETKCLRGTDTLFHPTPDKFTELVYAIIKNKSFALKDINFFPNKDIFKPTSIPALQNLLKVMQDNGTLKILIEGHTNFDPNTTKERDIRLSEDRAAAVKKYLADNGIDETRVTIKGYGSTRMIYAFPRTQDEQQANMRVEIKIEDF